MLTIVNDKTDKVSICKLDWGDVLLINALLIKESAFSKSPTVRRRADALLEGFEAAAESICEPTGDTGRIHE